MRIQNKATPPQDLLQAQAVQRLRLVLSVEAPGPPFQQHCDKRVQTLLTML